MNDAFFKPVAGQYEDISLAPDDIFSQKLVGPGFIVTPTDKCFYAPIHGKITMIYPTHHALVIHQENIDLMIHVGFTNVLRQSHYFNFHVAVGDLVSPGDLLFELNFDFQTFHPHDYLTALVFVQKQKMQIIEMTDHMYRINFN